MATQEISDGSYTAVRNKDTNEVTIRGTLRLNGTAEYAPIMALLEEALAAGMVTVDLRGLQFLNSSGIAFLMRFAVKVRDAKDLAFYPGSESTLPSDLVRSGEAKGDTLEFAFETAAETDRLVGVLEVNARQSDEKPRVYWIDSRRSGANREGVGTSKK